MTIKEILKCTKHRPWPLPTEGWKYYQEWNNAIFMHWKVDYNELQKLVPKELEIDLIEGKPWISVVAFTMEKMRLKNLPSFNPISNFNEINIRTYVKSKNKSGVYFLSIEGGNKFSCKIAKALSKLPYRFSKMKRNQNQYTSINHAFNDEFNVQFKINDSINDKSTLDKWLTERYVLFQDFESSIIEYEIHHVEWPIKKLEFINMELNYNRFEKFISNRPDKIHYSDGVQVIAWGKKK